MQTHLVRRRLVLLGVDRGFADVEERVDEGTFAGVAAAEDDQGTVVEFSLGAGLVEYL